MRRVLRDGRVHARGVAANPRDRVARAGSAARIHADELGPSGGSLVAAAVGARSADHLVFVPEAGIDAMAQAGVVATLLPVAAFYLKLGRFAPAREFIERGVPVALATDVNPGGGLSPSMPFAMTLACFRMEMTFEEALIAATINAAWSLDRASDVGSLEVRKTGRRRRRPRRAREPAAGRAPIAIAAVIKSGRVVHGGLERPGFGPGVTDA